MTRQEQIEAISGQWHEGAITAAEMARRIEGIDQLFNNEGHVCLNHKVMAGMGYLRCPGCDKQP